MDSTPHASSRASRPYEEELVDILRHGDMVSKVTTSTLQKLAWRTFWVTDDALHWVSEKKSKQANIPFKDVRSLLIGQKTENFQKYRPKVGTLEEASFSIVCTNRSVDFICTDKMQRDTWIKGLGYLIKKANPDAVCEEIPMAPAVPAPPAATTTTCGSSSSNNSSSSGANSRRSLPPLPIRNNTPEKRSSVAPTTSATASKEAPALTPRTLSNKRGTSLQPIATPLPPPPVDRRLSTPTPTTEPSSASTSSSASMSPASAHQQQQQKKKGLLGFFRRSKSVSANEFAEMSTSTSINDSTEITVVGESLQSQVEKATSNSITGSGIRNYTPPKQQDGETTLSHIRKNLKRVEDGSASGAAPAAASTSSAGSRLSVSAADDQSSSTLFELMVVVNLREENGGLVPFISYSFPPSNVQKKENQNIMLSVPQFCFPDIDIISKTDRVESKTYSFVLTDIDGSRRFGYCRRMLPKGEGKRLPETYCIISNHPCFGLFADLLDVVERRNQTSSVAVFAFLKTVLANPFPKRGETLNIQSQNLQTGTLERFIFTRPNDSDPLLEHVNFSTLFSSLKVQHIISVLASLLLERRIIFISNDISQLSSVSHAMLAVLYPFTWQHIFIPVLPKPLLDYVCSPVPFVVGVLSEHKHRLQGMPMEEVVMVDLETKQITRHQGSGPHPLPEDEKILPSSQASTLRQALEKLAKEGDSSRNYDKLKIADAFLVFFVNTFGDYSKFIHRDQQQKAAVNVKSFISSKSKKDKKFFEEVQQSQLFERFLAEKEKASNSPSPSAADVSRFDQRCREILRL